MLRLTKGEIYNVHLYPGVKVLKAKYVEAKDGKNVFDHDNGLGKILVDPRFIIEDRGIITHRNPNLKIREDVPRIVYSEEGLGVKL